MLADLRRSSFWRYSELSQAFLLVKRDALLNNRLYVTLHHAVERKIGREPMISTARVFVVVRPNLFRPRASSDLQFARRCDLRFLLFYLHLVQTSSQHLHRKLFVLELGTLLCNEQPDAGRLVRQIYSCFHLVHVLPTCSSRASCVHLNVLRINLYCDLVNLRHDSDRCRGSVDATLCLGCRNPLNTMHTCFEFELRVDRIALDLDGRVSTAAHLSI
mmetsp:Transcript_47040/g.77842  ORF Transcript_47040/g.77842 Transcript_47040/m.77842 type:complete len:217 (+) Transcript_47040:306-956(+)